MKQVKTAKGRIIDMGAMVKANEETRAVGNVPMNARGDRLDASGNVVATVQRVARTQHEHAQVPVKRPMSKATASSATQAPVDPVVISEETKTRDDGSQYIEIEYDDGSMETKEVE